MSRWPSYPERAGRVRDVAGDLAIAVAIACIVLAAWAWALAGFPGVAP